MKYTLLSTIILTSLLSASINTITSFEADFTQDITDDKDKTLSYNGHVIAKKPQYAKWIYKQPVEKTIYINKFEVTIVEPEIEQVIVRKIESNFDFFQMIANAKKIKKDRYEANYKNTKFTLVLKDNLIKKITYIDEFENDVSIIFSEQKQNKDIKNSSFEAIYSLEFDVIRD